MQQQRRMLSINSHDDLEKFKVSIIELILILNNIKNIANNLCSILILRQERGMFLGV